MVKKNGVVSVMGLLLITKILGFIKLRIIAQLFGATHDLDIFWAAFTIPDMIFLVIVGGSINAAIIPIFSDILYDKGKKRLDELFSKITFVFSSVLIILTILLFIFTPQLAQWLICSNKAEVLLGASSNLVAGDVSRFTNIMRIGLISPFILGLSSFITAYLQVRKQFFVTSLAPIFHNLGIIVFSIVFVGFFDRGIYGLAWASVIGSFFHLGVQIPLFLKYYKENDLPPLFSIKEIFKDSAVVKAIKLATPRILSILGEQFNVIVNTVISFTLTPGTLSAYKFAYSLHMVPINIIGSAVAQVSLPDLAKVGKHEDKVEFKKILDNALQFSMYLVLPLVAMIVILRLPIVRLTYGTGEFNWQDTLLTSMSLVLLSMSIIGQTIMQIVMRAFYALKDTWKPLIISLIGIAINLASVYFLTNFFSHYYDWRIIVQQIFYQISHANGAGVLPVVQSFFVDLSEWMTTRGDSPLAIGGLAVGVSMTYVIESIIGFIYLNKITSVKLITWESTLKPLFIKLLNTLIMGIGMYFVFKIFDLQLDTTRTIWVALLTAGTALYGSISYLLGSYLFKIKEFESIKKYLVGIIKSFIIKLKKKNA
ncbi:MAG: lipid II flippase MurJ [Candidatus Dojkabacteria bacterium]|nr:lipid II flippase MurJ [Candidatus Dojkabacteria bacterium]